MLHYDMAVVEAMIGPVKGFADVKTKVLILLGNRYQRTHIGKTIDMLEEPIGAAKKVQIRGSENFFPNKRPCGWRAIEEIRKSLEQG
jgi:hypothetical protein